MIARTTRRIAKWVTQVATYDFCPNWNAFVYWLKEPVGWVVVAIAFSLLVGILVGPQGYVLAFAFATVLILGMAWPWISMQGIRCHLVLPDRRSSENEKLEIVFRVKNYWPLPIFGMMVKGDFLQELGIGDEPIAFSLKHVGPWSESEFRIPLSPQRRGSLPTGEVITTNGFPFGLVDISKTVTRTTPAIVWPACVPLESLPITDSTRFSLQGALRDQSGDDGESIGVRCYRSGDRLRNIHWAQTVRTQRLMVRERQKISTADATVALDLAPSTHAGHGSQSSYEWTIRIAASICSHLHESQSLVRVVCSGLQTTAKTTMDNRLGLRAIMDFLSELPVMQAELAEENASQSESNSENRVEPHHQFGGHVFIIGTNLSERLPRESAAQSTPIIIDVAGFGDANTKSDTGPVSRTTVDVADQLDNGISITTPDSAADQLAHRWNRSFDNGC